MLDIERLTGTKGLHSINLGISKSGLEFRKLPQGDGIYSYIIREIKDGDIDALVFFIVESYRIGIPLSPYDILTTVCNYAHAQDIKAELVIKRILKHILDLGENASEYQRRARELIIGFIESRDTS